MVEMFGNNKSLQEAFAVAEVEFFGEKFRLVEVANDFALMEWSEAAENVEANSIAAHAATYRLLQESIHPDDWQRFRLHARRNKADATSLMPVVAAVWNQSTDRPTSLPADSSAGHQNMPESFVSPPADPVMDRFDGRPDMQLAVLRSRRSA